MALLSALTIAVLATPPAVPPTPEPPSITAPRLQYRPSPRWPAKRLPATQRRSHRIALGVGASLFTVFYLGTTAVAAEQLDDIHEDGVVERSERKAQRQSQIVFVPVVGPLVGATMTKSKGDIVGLVGLGVAQGLMVSLGTVSAIALARDARARRFGFDATASRHGAHAAFRVRF